jgi:hypothetical protein
MIKVILLTILASGVLGITFPLYNQCDSRWGQDQLGTSSKTICSSGCLVSSAAMALYGVGNTSINPGTLNKWLISNGGYSQGNLFVWTSINKLGVSFIGFFNNSAIKSLLDQGKILILNVRNGGHWVLATRISGDTIYVNDPGYSVSSYTLSQVVNGNTGAYTPNRLPNFITNFIIDISEFLRFLIGSQEESPFLPAPIPDDDIQQE